MSISHYAKVADVTGFDNATQRFLFLEMAARADRKGIVRMPQSELAEVTLLSPATVKRVFRSLEELSIIERIGHGRYRIVFDDLEDFLGNDAPVRITLQEGAESEMARLHAIMRPDQGIAYRADGWPVLVPLRR